MIFFLILNFNFRKNVFIFGVGNSSSTHTDNRKKYKLFLGEKTTQRLEDKCYINFAMPKNMF